MKEVKQLHETATALLRLIQEEKDRKDRLYKNYRQWCHFSSREWLEKYEHDIDICDRAIKRLKESYFKTINKISEHGKAN